jgi:protein-S-isoprenylcysteine O-methyltransferase Ste14
MGTSPSQWFPGPHFSTALAVVVVGAYLVDYTVPKWLALHDPHGPARTQDRGSYVVIQLVALAAVGWAAAARYLGLAVTPAAVQYAGLVLIVAAVGFREWAIVRLGRFFSRTVQVEPGQRLITDGPYRWLRHPAYTGMVLMYAGLGLALGSWVGAAGALALMLGATMYRISVEETLLVHTFGDAYCDYKTHTWRLFPGW